MVGGCSCQYDYLILGKRWWAVVLLCGVCKIVVRGLIEAYSGALVIDDIFDVQLQNYVCVYTYCTPNLWFLHV